ncbi:MAG: IS4 family transposase [Pleurocapsa sp. MO_226.B13]|nr:IS4 family transposase [Pleurocapsa sp. MO_226.B13]
MYLKQVVIGQIRSATYNFWNSDRLGSEEIIDGHRRKTAQRASEEEVILAIQDTSDFNFTHHKSKTWDRGFGQTCSQKYVRGLKVHSTLASSSQGVPLGILDLQIWTRKPTTKIKKKKPKGKRSILQKESKRWLRGLVDAELAIPSTTKIVTVADREGDIYELFALPRETNSELLIRAKHNRRVDHSMKYLRESVSEMAEAGTLNVSVPKKDGQPPQQATLTIRVGQLTILPPSNLPQTNNLKPITLNVISAVEAHPAEGSKPINWLLLTTKDVNNWEDTVCYIRWYTYRWLIERFHFVLKSGCGIEKLQLETAERIKKALATYAIVAWRLLWLTYHARENPSRSSDTVLERHEWQSLYCHIHHTSSAPKQAPSLKQAIIWIAQLGGFLGRKNDGEPGVKSLWRGLQRLHDIAATWKLAKSSPSKFCETYG